MPLLTELRVLAHRTVRVWLHHFPQLTIILGCGWIVYTVCVAASATLGTRADPLPSILFAIGVCAQVVSVILAIVSLKPSLVSPDLIEQQRDRMPDDLPIPKEVFKQERPVDVAIAAIGPVLAIYVVWELLDDMIRDGMLWNIMLQGLGNPTWSVSLAPDRFPAYLIVGLTALVLRVLWTRLAKNRSSWWRAPVVLFEGTWTAMSFFILLGVYRVVMEWVWSREFYRQLDRLWYGFISWLPPIPLPDGSTLPEAVVNFTNWISETLIPEIWMGIVLPLMWLSVTAMVFGWRRFDVRDLLDRTSRERAEAAMNRSKSWLLLSRLGFLVKDLREKYLPLIHCWRLMWRAGVFILGAFLMLAAVLTVLSYLMGTAVLELISRIDQTAAFLSADLVGRVIMPSLTISLYAVTFDRSIKEILSIGRSIPAAPPHKPGSSPDHARLPPPDPSQRLDTQLMPGDTSRD